MQRVNKPVDTLDTVLLSNEMPHITGASESADWLWKTIDSPNRVHRSVVDMLPGPLLVGEQELQ